MLHVMLCMLQGGFLVSRYSAILLFFVLCRTAFSGSLGYSRPVRPWEFTDAVGQQASLLGKEDGTLEGYVYPLKIFSDLQFSFEVGGHVIPAATISRRIDFTSATTTITYSGDEFQVVETLIVPVHEPGGIVRLQITAHDPVTVRFSLHPDFQLMWPAAFGSGYAQWHPENKQFVFGADGTPYKAVLSSPDLQLEASDYATNYSVQTKATFSLGTVSGTATRVVAFGGSMKTLEEAAAVEQSLAANQARIEQEAADFYDRYLTQTVRIAIPDKDLQRAYDWSRLSLAKGVVDNPFLGKGLVAGYGPSKGFTRPGYGWFFGRDTFWSTFALNIDGDFTNSREAIAFISRFQREDGKVPHEISQSAHQVNWAKDFPYEYSSADATPLFVTAVRDYVQASGDTAFAQSMWDRAQKAIAFSRSTVDSEGFPKNFGVGHGWIEGGPLLPVRVELYMAGCYVEALRSMAQLAEWSGHTADAAGYRAEAAEKQRKLDRVFWQKSGTYALAIDNNGKQVDQPSVLEVVPQWWDLLPLNHMQSMTEQISDEDHASDWGLRILSSKAPLYSPAGYHFGSVWPLFTGWAALSGYRSHLPDAGYMSLKANSWLALDAANGNTTEVLSGETYSALSTASPHQIWSAAMIVSPLLKGLFGLNVDGAAKEVTLQPYLPPSWPKAELSGIHVGAQLVDIHLSQDDSAYVAVVINHGSAPIALTLSPSYSPYTTVSRVLVNGKPQRFDKETFASNWRPTVKLSLAPGQTKIEFRHENWFGITVPAPAPKLAETSSNLKLVSQRWSSGNKEVTYTFSGLSGRTYSFPVAGSSRILHVDGATLDNGECRLQFPAGAGYVHHEVKMRLQ